MEILGIGTPIIDYIVRVSETFIETLPGIKGGSDSVSFHQFNEIIQKTGKTPELAVGGSTSNTIKGLANLEHFCSFFGKVGNDDAGRLFRNTLDQLNINPNLLIGDHPTGRVLCLITPDYERTMRAFLEAGSEITAGELSAQLFNKTKVVHLEGFLLDHAQLVPKAMKLAKEAGAKISFDVSSVEIIQEHSKILFPLIESYVDILFANEEESYALTGKPPEQSCDILKSMCEIAVVKMGEKGNWAATTKNKVFEPALKVKTVDTTGAGDLFATGFLHGYLSSQGNLEDIDLKKCSRYGALVASEVVQIIGADIPAATWEKIKKHIAD